MRGNIWSVGVLLGLAGSARAVPTIDCTGIGELVGIDAGYIAIDDQVIEIARIRRGRGLDAAVELPREAHLPVYVDAVLSPEAFCADHGGLVAFILPVPKVNPGAPVDPDRPVPEVGEEPVGPPAGFHVTGGGTGYSMTGGKSQVSDVEEESLETGAPDEAQAVPEPGASPLPAEAEPAPSPSREPESTPDPFAGAAGCSAAPGGPHGLGWMLMALLLLRRKGEAK